MVTLSVWPVGRAAPLGLRGLRSMTRASGHDLQLGPIPQPPLIPGALAFLCPSHPPAVGFNQNAGFLH